MSSGGAARRAPPARDAAAPLEPYPPAPAPNGGEFLLQLLRRPPQSSRSAPSIDAPRPLPPHPNLHPNDYDDPAVAAVGPSHSLSPPSHALPPWLLPPVLPQPPRFSTPSFPPPRVRPQFPHHDGWDWAGGSQHHQREPPLRFGGFVVESRLRACSSAPGENGGVVEVKRFHESPPSRRAAGREDRGGRRVDVGKAKAPKREHRAVEANYGFGARNLTRGVLLEQSSRVEAGVGRGSRLVESGLDVERVGRLGGRELAESSLEVEARELVEVQELTEASLSNNEEEGVFGEEVGGSESRLEVGIASRIMTVREEGELVERVAESLVLKEENEEMMERDKLKKTRGSRGKDYRLDTSRGRFVLSQGRRYRRAAIPCRCDINRLTPYLLSLYLSLIPTEEEKAKQKQLLLMLQKLVNREWPDVQLHLYGSCANSFGVSNSDIDVCLAINDNGTSKSDILLKLADLLQSDNLQNVQALTHARVPIVKLMDPVTGISCDICINNLLAVVNTKLLRDYAQIDDRLRQLAFIVKHWAKSRNVNETYQGTLSSYAYVLMCIHFLQSRIPTILPCLQGMEATYKVTVENIECSFFDQVKELRGFGSRNKESIAELVWAFFHYWAYRHDYANDVISIRVGGILSKQEKDWTRRIGNDRHLICIEDPFEISHDLGRVVDKFSIKILREEFERAAEILQFDPNPMVTLFETYVRGSPPPPS